MTPEHLHLVLVHLPIVGVFAALVPLAWGVLRKDRTSVGLGLAMAAAFALVTPLLMASGEAAEERLEHGRGPSPLDAAGEQWMEVHEERAEVGAVVLYVAAALFAAGLVAVVKKGDPAWTRGVGAGALGVGAVSVLALVWVADAGGKIRHPELRGGPAPSAQGGGAGEGHEHDD